ncbi:ATP-binding cassette domain-containing protein [Streptomyces sp. ISL-21]|nr:ATP-binding cassette domain-containing protein [Streptomyces sp. ISL-21]
MWAQPGPRPPGWRPAPSRQGQGASGPGSGATDGPPGRGSGAAQPGRGVATPDPGVLLRARGLRMRYPTGEVLRGVDLDVPGGLITGIVGENGAGKSTLLHCLAGTIRAAAGRITLDGRDITALPPHARARIGLARTFQQPAVFGSLTVTDNIRVGAEHGLGRGRSRGGGLGRGPGEGGGAGDSLGAATQAMRLLALLPDRDTLTARLPTGALRRTELARALAGSPRVLLLDEPTAGLDEAEVAVLALLLRALAADGMALVVIEHDLEFLSVLAGTLHTLKNGRLHAT